MGEPDTLLIRRRRCAGCGVIYNKDIGHANCPNYQANNLYKRHGYTRHEWSDYKKTLYKKVVL